MTSRLLRTKSMTRIMADTENEGQKLRRALTAWDLTAIGIGCIIGVGIFVLPGVQAAHNAGPAIILSFAIASLACACSALCYAELAAMIPVSGSAYTYGYATLGEIFGWVIGWDLIIEYMVAAILVAVAAAVTSIDISSELCSIGTLFAYIIVASGVIVLRFTRPDINRPFKAPLSPALPGAGIILCSALMARACLSAPGSGSSSGLSLAWPSISATA